jgi:hypothetical protein
LFAILKKGITYNPSNDKHGENNMNQIAPLTIDQARMVSKLVTAYDAYNEARRDNDLIGQIVWGGMTIKAQHHIGLPMIDPAHLATRLRSHSRNIDADSIDRLAKVYPMPAPLPKSET